MKNGFIRSLAAAVLIAASAVAYGASSSSPYRHAIGIRIGNQVAADYKYFLSSRSALDFTFGVVNPFCPEYQFLLFSGAYEYNFSTGVERLSPYIGAGISLGAQFGDRDRSLRDKVSFFMSADIPVGLEYTLKRKPVVFVFEWSPKLQFLGKVRFLPQSAAVGFRFIFPRRAK